MHWVSDWMYLSAKYGVPWLIFGLYLVGAWFLSGWAMKLLRGLLSRLTARGAIRLEEAQLTEAARPVRFVVMMVGLALGINALIIRLPGLMSSWPEFVWIERGVVALIILAITSLINGVVKAAMDWYLHNLAHQTRSTWDDELLPLLRKVVSVVLYFIAISIILTNFGVNITALVTTAGVASLAVSLAAQDTLSNVIGGIMILVDRPFRVGDMIELLDGRSGIVQEISLRTTRIRQFDGNALVVPNKDMANSRLINYAQPTLRAAIRQTIRVALDTDVDKAKEVVLRTIQAHPEVLKDPAPIVRFATFGASSLDLFMSCWVEDFNTMWRVQDELNTSILRALRAAGIELATQHQTVWIHMEDEGDTASPGRQIASQGEE